MSVQILPAPCGCGHCNKAHLQENGARFEIRRTLDNYEWCRISSNRLQLHDWSKTIGEVQYARVRSTHSVGTTVQQIMLDEDIIVRCLMRLAILILIIQVLWEDGLTRFSKIAIRARAQMAVDKEAVGLSRVHMYC